MQQIQQGTITPVMLEANHFYIVAAGGSSLVFHTPADGGDAFVTETIESKTLLFRQDAYCPHYIGNYPSNVKATYIKPSELVVYINCVKSGYTPIGIVGWNMEMGQVSDSSPYKDFRSPEQINLWSCSLTTLNTAQTNGIIVDGDHKGTLPAGSYVICQMTNTKNVKAAANIKIKVLYKKN